MHLWLKGQSERADMGKAARRRIFENFAIRRVAAQYEKQ
ncbi:conserved hypothetical protein [delta proteobacterium NaphS2]|nr:conserved hypothetical protein [delta proteobacterium NaphS2]